MSSAYRRTVRGMRDLLPEEAEKLRFIEQSARETARLNGYREVITPIVEHLELLAAKLGEENRQRMYVFEDLGGRQVALRPEFTASIARLVSTKLVAVPKPLRLFSVGSLYRYDEPQFGRYREFWQANYELFGSNQPEADAEILTLTNDFLGTIGLKDYRFKVGHVGIVKGILTKQGLSENKQNIVMQLLDKKEYDAALNQVKQEDGTQSCLDTLQGLFDIRGDDPVAVMKEISEITSGCSPAIKAVKNLSEILNLLGTEGIGGKILVDAAFARGLEYYTGMIFEAFVPEMEVALGGGGRYDNLIELFGGGEIPAVGVAPGLDRLTLAIERQGNVLQISEGPRILVVPVNREMLASSFRVAALLRASGLGVKVEVMGRSVSKALSDADRREISHAVIVGPKEMKENCVVLRQMAERNQETIRIDKLVDALKKSRR